MDKQLVLILLLAASMHAQVALKATALVQATAGGASLISEVSSGSQRAIQTDCSSPSNKAFPGNVTNGDDITVTVIGYQNGSYPSHTVPAKASGTSTIGAFVEDKNFRFDNTTDFFIDMSVWRAPVTGTGSLTLSFTVTGQTCSLQAIDEFHRTGGAMTVDGTPSSKTATGATESTNAISTSTGGMCIMTSTEAATGNFTYASRSDTNIGSIATGATTFTGEAQFKITSSSGSPTLSISSGNSWIWGSIGVCYK